MEDTELEERLRAFDFSLCCPVREKLLAELLSGHPMKRGISPSPWTAGQLSDDEMDWVVAAGTPAKTGRTKELPSSPK